MSEPAAAAPDESLRITEIFYSLQGEAAELAAQAETFRAYLGELGSALQGELDERNAQGVMVIQQICEQLLPHIEVGDIPLAETLVVEVQRTPGVNLVDLLG